MSDFICDYCNRSLKTKYILAKHIKTSKKCLIIQQSNIKLDLYNCNYCNFTTNQNIKLDIHQIKCLENHKDVIEKCNNQIKDRDDKIIENKNIILEKNNIISNLQIKFEKQKTEIECLTKTVSDLQQMLMKSRKTTTTTTNTNYITNQQKIEYSKANLHPYSELTDNLSNIINSKFNFSTFQTIENVATFITNDILNYNNKEYYHCFDAKGSIFHKKNGDEIDVDEKAEKLLNDILPKIIDKSRKIYVDKSEEYNDKNSDDKNDEKELINLSNALKCVRNISKKGSDERNLCIRRIANCYCVSSNQLKSYKSSGGEENRIVEEEII
jgi:hypothetical protein